LANKTQSKDSTQSTMVGIQLPSSFRKNPNPFTPLQWATIIAPIQVAPLCTIDGLPYPWGADVLVGTASTAVSLPAAYPFGHYARRCCLYGCFPCKRPARG
ncbi:hypothetical protein B296_00049034, partial [Ensete ventricosum]